VGGTGLDGTGSYHTAGLTNPGVHSGTHGATGISSTSGGRHDSTPSSASSRPVRPRRGGDDKGRDCLVLGWDGLTWRRSGRGGRPSTTDAQNWPMGQILVLK